jgi:hypothetical protein
LGVPDGEVNFLEDDVEEPTSVVNNLLDPLLMLANETPLNAGTEHTIIYT